MRHDPHQPISRRAALELWLGLGTAIAAHSGCSRSESPSQAKPTPSRLTFMRDKGRAAQAARSDQRGRKAGTGHSPSP